jgi:hypothetical protein
MSTSEALIQEYPVLVAASIYGENNPRTTLSDVRQGRELAAAGEDLRSLAAEFGVTGASVTQLVTGQHRRASGGPIREARPRSKLTAEDLAEIHRLAEEGVKQSELARRHGVRPYRISKVISDRKRSMSKEG